MQGFEDITIQLLLRHNCVVVPGFGGFVAKQISAELDFQKGLLSPPKKALLFNRFLLTDDGLFLAEYARQQGLFYEEAKLQLQAYTDLLQRQLLLGQTVKLAKLGTFYRQTDGQINFEQDRFFNLLLSSYGLNQLNFVSKPININQTEQEVAPAAQLPNTKVKWVRIAAAACFLPLAFYSVWIPTQTNALQSGLFATSDFNPLYHQAAPAYKKTGAKSITTIPKSSSNLDFERASKSRMATYVWQRGYAFNVQVPAAPVAKPISNEATALTSTAIQSNATAAYDYIVGCFSNLQNAQNLQLKLQRDGFVSRLIQNGPLTKVSAGAAQNLNELQQIQQQAAARGLQGWVLKN